MQVPYHLQRRVQDPIQSFGHEAIFHMFYFPNCWHFTAGVAVLTAVGASVGIYSQRAGFEPSFPVDYCDEEELHARKEPRVC